MKAKVPVAVLGATGTVGQKFVRLLAGHPWFEITALAASDQSAGRPYGEVVRWRETFPLPDRLAAMTISRCEPPLPARIAFSALDADAALPIEQTFAKCGMWVVTNTRVHRMDPDVPLMIPEINAGHLELVERQ
ncbi:MAG TPA: aspartate-semialdehyde dehydrogenase, partial [Gemmatimonadales bacterium]|nr:aspartate-semialdehyde dehydrogenase [Gemmatimonadales bacterium]